MFRARRIQIIGWYRLISSANSVANLWFGKRNTETKHDTPPSIFCHTLTLAIIDVSQFRPIFRDVKADWSVEMVHHRQQKIYNITPKVRNNREVSTILVYSPSLYFVESTLESD